LDWDGKPLKTSGKSSGRPYAPPIQPPPPGITEVPSYRGPPENSGAAAGRLEPLEPGTPEPKAKTDPEGLGKTAEPPRFSAHPGNFEKCVTVYRRKRSPAREVKLLRKKGHGRYGIYTGGKVAGANGQILDVLLFNGESASHDAAKKTALEIAREGPGTTVEVHRLLDRFVLREVTKVALVSY